MTNEALAYELLLDPAFTITSYSKSNESNISLNLSMTLRGAFWKGLADDLRLSPPSYVRVVRVLGEIRDKIGELCVPTIPDTVDVDLLLARMKARPVPWGDRVSLLEGVAAIVSALPGYQTHDADVADADADADAVEMLTWARVKELTTAATSDSEAQPYAFVAALQYLSEQVEVVRVFGANARLRFIAPVIQDHGAEYLRAHAEARFAQAVDPVKRTQRWIHSAIASLFLAGEVACEDLLTNDCAKTLAFNAVLREAFVALVTGSYVCACTTRSETPPETPAQTLLLAATHPFTPTSEYLPETLSHDTGRLSKMFRIFYTQVKRYASPEPKPCSRCATCYTSFIRDPEP